MFTAKCSVLLLCCLVLEAGQKADSLIQQPKALRKDCDTEGSMTSSRQAFLAEEMLIQ